MDILADVNVPEEYVSALRGDGHTVQHSRAVNALGPETTNEAIVAHAESEGLAILTTDVTDFADRDATVAVFVAPQSMSGGAVQRAVARIAAMPLDPADAEPIWLSAV